MLQYRRDGARRGLDRHHGAIGQARAPGILRVDIGRVVGTAPAQRRQVVRDRIYLEHRLRDLPGIRVYPAQANFVYMQMPAGMDGVALRNRLLCEHGCLIRECGNKLGSDSRHYRVAARPAEELDYLVECLAECFNALARPAARRPRSADQTFWSGR